ncbi:hypothetical protein PENSPDRAFT_652601 [Peniophora sp. CONT]|nr:hypothetical protein PENSPDRAFT_652601 [Peniophora sp. CONT]
MAKSTRSKVKRAHRAKKREDSVYAAVEAARLQRLNAKLVGLTTQDPPTEEVSEDEEGGEDEKMQDDAPEAGPSKAAGKTVSGAAEIMDIDPSATPKKISTHGPRNSRREAWRISKGMAARPKARGMNRQGGIASKTKPGRPQRRR